METVAGNYDPRPLLSRLLQHIGNRKYNLVKSIAMPKSHFNEAVVTLYEKQYHYGVAALINSLHKHHFDGLVYIGYKGILPEWVSQLEPKENGYYELNGLSVKFERIDTSMHFGYYKPEALINVLNQYHAVESIYYFDPDIVINTDWIFFKNWTNSGICFCLDNCFSFVHRNHPWRKEWIELNNSTLKNDIDFYVNGGFIGLKRRDKNFLERWIGLTYKYQCNGGDISKYMKDGSRAIKTDQDILNATITISPDLPLSIIGTEGMGFSQPAYLMSHAVSNIKPWKKNFLKHLIQYGIKPSTSEKDYMIYANYPIAPYSRRSFWLKANNLKLAAALGRVIG